MSDGLDGLLDGQLAYYRARAPEYDEVYDERGFSSLTNLVDELPIGGDVLELACGTGQWTVRLAPRAAQLTAVDGAPEMLDIAQRRLEAAGLTATFRQEDLFAWRPQARYDTVFFAFWLSHVPPQRFAAFWAAVAAAVRPGGRVVFVDTDAAERRTERAAPGGRETVLRRLKDGSEHEVVKLFHDAAGLAGQLGKLGWTAQVDPADGGFIRGVATLTDRSARD
ncbi:methyltransferase domain-containing protein [Dactylosporangium sp. NBC_01737]|uniref:class I SAM-dependent methyltransferase n=1 Tax=Dactylosporangium sp. NBC_01737 TaxID=2975959 RepID=UPI002E12F8CF|nr:methyltransferase domain-containing protein [Dactylosporangium sp. NBC_01737]